MSSRRAVFTALSANLVLTLAKVGAWLGTGSASMLSEAVHSAADTANQGLLAVGLFQAEHGADADHPYGYARDRFVWALI